MSKLIVFTDGGARGNPGRGAIGVVITTEGSQILAKISRTIGQTTNNVAEYSAVIAGLTWIKQNAKMHECMNAKMIQFFLDSILVVNQLNGLFKVKNPELRNLLVKIRELEQEAGGNVMYTVIPREKNKEADALVNQALDKEIQMSKFEI